MAYRDFKDLTRRAASDKVLRDKVINISKYRKYDGFDIHHISVDLLQWSLNFLIKQILVVV